MPTPLSFDPISGGKSIRVGTPYQFWQGNLPDEAGTVIEFIINERIFSTTVGEDGNWSFQPPLFFKEGSHNVTMRGFDLADNHGEPHQFSLEVDLSAPFKPAITSAIDDVGKVTGGIGNGQITDDTTPTLKGYAQPGSIVQLYDFEQWVGSTVALQNGEWTIKAQLGNGEHQLKVTATDEFDRVSESSDRYVLQVDDSPGIPATISYAMDDVGTVQGKLNSGASTDDFAPVIVGRAEPNSIVYLYAQNSHGGIGYKGSVLADANGDWSIQSRSMISGDGLYTFHATYVNSIADYRPDFALNMKALKDIEPTIEFAHDDAGAMTGAVYHRGTTDDKTPTLEGKGAPGSVVEIEYKLSNGSWQSAGSATVDQQGNWQVKSAELSNYGEWAFRARGVTAGQTSDWSDNFELIMIPGAPLAPSINFANDDVGLVQDPVFHNGTTDDNTPTLQGTGTPGQIIEIEFGLQGESLRSSGTARVGEDGKWSFTSPQLDQPGIWEYQARASTGEMKSNWSDKFHINLVEEAQISSVEPEENSNLTLQQLLVEDGEGLFIDSSQLELQDTTAVALQLEDILPQGTEASDWMQETATANTAAQYHVYSHDNSELLLQDGAGSYAA
ncbi:Ig-like domain-containing protein [Pantoea sp. GM01]|uniref:Ig-like domain-containing protein n=1 Tax=Pantoea sp. GM01 TaxID=1144320 RepID=UPI000270E995|nr:Ig-like domain-containing protein [Pantoea sp. GM01]EJL88077.1 hypothetical protein PMI17_02837 [Pantoea sp. GM01]